MIAGFDCSEREKIPFLILWWSHNNLPAGFENFTSSITRSSFVYFSVPG